LTGGGGWGGLGVAMVFVLLTYGGWNEAAYLSAEVRGGRRGIVKVLLGGIALIMVVYVLVNLAYLNALGLFGVATSNALAADVLRRQVGNGAASFIAVIIVVAALGNMNATMITGARTSYALGRDFPLFAPLGRWRDKPQAPVTALVVQGVMTVALVVFGALQRNGLESMVQYTTPVFWLFFLLTGVSLIVLRYRDPAAQRPFRVPLFPVTPLAFCAVCAYMLYSGVVHFGRGALVGVVVLALGTPLMLVARRRAAPYARGGSGAGFEPLLPPAAATDRS
jgi:APA family basic amino acid/polyamine antiporter